MVQKIKFLNDAALKSKAVSVQSGDDIKPLIVDMFDTMYANSGIGLAANQIGSNLDIFVLDTKEEKGVFINTTIIESSDPAQYEEACLSVPGASAKISRFSKIKVKFFDENFTEQEKIFTGLTAIAIQHEIDHLNGKLYIDRLPPMAKMLAIKQHKTFLNRRVRR